nr:hypothetical protein [Amycolatopsis lexingtonensis]
MPKCPKELVGRWRLVVVSGWDREAVDLDGPGFIEFAADGTGQIRFVAVTGWLDCRAIERGGSPGVEFTWEGADEGDQVSGRGWAVLIDDTIEGHLFFHLGDDSSFRAKPFTGADERGEL